MSITVAQGDPRTITIDQGRNYEEAFEYTDDTGTPVNLTGYTIRAQVKKYPGGPKVATFGWRIDDAAGGTFRLSLTPTESARIKENCVYDVVLVLGSSLVDLIPTSPIRLRPSVSTDPSPNSRLTWGAYHYLRYTWRQLSRFKWKDL